MRGGFLAAKALFMIAILVFVTFSVSDLSQVSAVETGQNVCCEKTTSGDSCVYTDSGSCDASALQATTSCDQTAFCKTGCCISDEGKCSKSVSKSTCENTNGYSWQEGAACEVSACDKNCCVVGGSQCAYTTESNCEQLIEGLEDITLDWRAVDSESSCTSICNNADKGACMSDSGCTYGTQGDCAAPTIDYTSGNGFYKDTYCSDMGNSGCTAHADKKCVDEDVYNFDSCGNQEEKAVDCDYTKGTWCGADANGDLGCQSTDCLEPTFDGVYSVNGETTNRDTHDSKIGKTRKNGESWCLYESPAGGYFDRPGSQQYRAYCSFGKEYVEACKDFREQVCIQYPFTSFHDFSIFDSMDDWNKAGGDAYTSDIPSAGAACIDNGVYQDLINANVTTVPKGGDFWSGSTELADTCSTANLECPVTYARDTSMDSWHCVQNCYCLTQEWVDQAANYCATRGDCGAKYDLAGNYQGDTFYITRSQEALSADNVTIGMTFVAYDQACDDEYYAQGATDVCPKRGTALNCYQKVDGTSEIDGSCSFENALSTAETQLLQNNYGVYGGMIGFSQSIGQYIAANYQILSTGALVGYIALASTIVGAVGLATFSIAAVVVGAGAGFAAGAAGVFGAASGITGALTGAAAGASTVPIAGWIVAAVLIIAAIISYVIISGGETTTVTISSNCQPWQPVQGVDNCDLCDKPVSEGGFALDDSKGNILPGYGCSEYKCRSLGSGCEYIQENEGTDRPTCFGTASNDVNHPVIQNAYLLDTYQDLSVSFAKDNNLIVNDKVAPYTFFSFGIETDELSQ
ncbi:hypothetical protein HZA98_00115, partial [Candidatus Woesearchaeota archaeon]|nr:hypothetical protein [Candidatus Woesearchaeota archaeon]